MKLRTWCIRIRQLLTKTGPALNIALLLLLVCSSANTAFAETDTQGITLRQQNAPLEKIFQSIEKQTGYRFFYNESLLEGATKVSLNLQNASLQEALDACFQNQPFSYAIVEKTIIIKRKVVAPRAVSNAPMNKIIAVRGKVTSNNAPVVGATVTVKGTENGTSTDVEGVFTLSDVDDQGTLVVSHVSHEAKEVRLKGQSFIAIDLNDKVTDLDEAVVVAYNATTQRRNTGSVSTVRGESIKSLPNLSIDRSLQGMVPGLLVTNGNGQPGGGVSNFVLRGIGTGTNATFGSNVRHPLIVIDGMPISTEIIVGSKIGEGETPISNPLSQLNQNDIESISILKDASAIALYGSRASNGVILITTKKGKAGKEIISFRQQIDIASKAMDNVKLLNQEEYLELLYESYKNSNSTLWTDRAILKDLFSKFPFVISSPGDTSFYDEPNWSAEIFNNKAVTSNSDLSFSGSNEKISYYLGFGYLNQKGIVKNTGYKRGTVRYNFENHSRKWLKVGIKSMLSYNKQDYAAIGEGASDIMGFSSVISPLNPVRLTNGDFYYNYSYGTTTSASRPVPNPAASLKFNINRLTSYRGLGSFYSEIGFLKNFNFSTNIGIDFMLSQWKEKVDRRLAQGSLGPGIGKITDQDILRTSFNITNLLKYNYNFINKHSFNILLGQETRASAQRSLVGAGEGISVNYYEELINTTSNYFTTGNISKENLLSYFGQINYEFSSKYLLSLNARKDGTSKFGNDKQFKNYWSLGAGWNISQEKLINTISWLNYFKIRGSIGTSGNTTVISALTKYYLLTLSNFNGNTAAYPGAFGNDDIEPEEPFNIDLGFEISFLKGRATIIADWYKRKIKKLIYPVSLPNNSGYSNTLLKNIGDMENNGVEIALSAKIIQAKDLIWKLDANWSTNNNRLVRASTKESTVGRLANIEGENFNSFYLVRWAGVNPDDGKPQWLDLEGKVTNTYNLSNRVLVGKPQPDGFGGLTNSLTYKWIELSLFFYYQYGFSVYDNASATSLLNDGGTNPYINQSRDALDRWQKPGDIATNPRRVLNNTDGGRNASTRYLYDGDFIRLKNVYLSFYLPSKLFTKTKVNSLRVYFQGNNLALWARCPKGLDPENMGSTGLVSFAYPQQKTFSIGLDVNF